ncbi:hypothetical protein AeNC1_016539, partial [Aphanomyces euteiches]
LLSLRIVSLEAETQLSTLPTVFWIEAWQQGFRTRRVIHPAVEVLDRDYRRHLFEYDVQTDQTTRKMAEFEKGSISTAVCVMQISMAFNKNCLPGSRHAVVDPADSVLDRDFVAMFPKTPSRPPCSRDYRRHLFEYGVQTDQTTRKMAEFEKGSISTAVCGMQISMTFNKEVVPSRRNCLLARRHIDPAVSLMDRDMTKRPPYRPCGVQSFNAWHVDDHRHLLKYGGYTDQTSRKMATHQPCGQCFEVSFCKGHIDSAAMILDRGISATRKMAEFEKGSISTAVCLIQFSMASIEMVSRLEAVSDDACQDICGVQSINAWYVDIHRHLLQDGVHTDQ